jgi:hypothetical protein
LTRLCFDGLYSMYFCRILSIGWLYPVTIFLSLRVSIYWLGTLIAVVIHMY